MKLQLPALFLALASAAPAQSRIEWAETLDVSTIDAPLRITTDAAGNVYTVGSTRENFSAPQDWLTVAPAPMTRPLDWWSIPSAGASLSARSTAN